MPVATTALYAALLGLMQIVLQQLVGCERLHAEVSLGDGGDPKLREATGAVGLTLSALV